MSKQYSDWESYTHPDLTARYIERYRPHEEGLIFDDKYGIAKLEDVHVMVLDQLITVESGDNFPDESTPQLWDVIVEHFCRMQEALGSYPKRLYRSICEYMFRREGDSPILDLFNDACLEDRAFRRYWIAYCKDRYDDLDDRRSIQIRTLTTVIVSASS